MTGSRLLVAVSSPWASQNVATAIVDLARRLESETLVVHVARSQDEDEDDDDEETFFLFLNAASKFCILFLVFDYRLFFPLPIPPLPPPLPPLPFNFWATRYYYFLIAAYFAFSYFYFNLAASCSFSLFSRASLSSFSFSCTYKNEI